MANLIFLDTETFGFSNTQTTFENISEWASIREIAWIIYTEQGELIKEENFTLTESTDLKEGPLHEIMGKFIDDLNHYKPTIIGHKIDFDKNLIGATLLKLNFYNFLINHKTICTMIQTVDFCDLPKKKYPKLEELYYKLFNEYFEGSHHAILDAQATAKCYFELKRKGFVFKENEDAIFNYPAYQRQIELLKQNRDEAFYKTFAFLELLDICRTMPNNLPLNEQIRYLNSHYFDTSLKRISLTNKDNELTQEQISFFKFNEKELLKNLELEEENEKFLNESKKLVITPLIGSRLFFRAMYSGRDKTEKDFYNIALKFNTLTFFYELWMIRNIPKQKKEEKSDSSITFKDLWEQTRNQIKRNEFNYEKIPTIPFKVWPSEEELIKYPAMETQVTESLDELEKTLIVMVPYFKINTAVALLYTVSYLESLIKRLDKKHEPRILSMRVRLMNAINERPKSGCYIATCCYQDSNASEVVLFRIFRDTYLMNNYFGKIFVKYYYRFSPKIANILNGNRTINLLVKNTILSPIYNLLRVKYKI